MTENKQYYLGLDIGSASIGWSATDEDYKILNIKNKKALGVRMFTEAETAVDRRTKRTQRRRYERRRYRLQLLKELFRNEIEKIDATFFNRLEESKFYLEDKTVNSKYVLFNDENYTDKNFYSEYKTIYHLREHLLKKENPDIRELYLACHHILKYRGNFIFSGETLSNDNSIIDILHNLKDEICFNEDTLLLLEDDAKLEKLETILLNKNSNKLDKVKNIKILFNKNKQLDAFFKLAIGIKSKLDIIFENENYKEADKNEISFEKPYEETRADYEAMLGDDITTIDLAKKIYDAIILTKIKEPGLTISESKVKHYNKHKVDLKLLKNVIKNDKKLSQDEKIELYKNCFTNKIENNYLHYAGRGTLSKDGNIKTNNSSKKIEYYSKASYEDFKKFITNTILKNLEETEEVKEIKSRLELGDFLLLQKTRDNGVIPYQVHLEELKLILENAEKYYPFLKEKTDGYSTSEKIIMLHEFRIPYYIGPLNNYHKNKGGNAWIVRNSSEKITPWNFKDVVNEEASATQFIEKMTNNCTYLLEEKVIPKNSLLYSEYELLNELNVLNIDGVRLSIDVRNDIIETFFKNKVQKLTKNKLEKYLQSTNVLPKDKKLAGIDIEIKSNLKSYVETKNILGEKFDNVMVENIISWLTLFGETKKLVINKIKENYGEKLNDDEINKLANLRYKGWGRFSEKLLTGIYSEKLVDLSTGEIFNIINAMRNNMLHFMELLREEKGYTDAIENYNKKLEKPIIKVDYDIVNDIYVSPSVKRAVWQTLKIVEEIRKLLGKDPKKIFIETIRSNKAEKKRTDSRKTQLEKLFKNLKDDKQLLEEVAKQYPDEYFKTKKIWLYCTQLGKCIYSGEEINLSELFNNNIYDIDHIYPRSKTKDDSLHNNLVLTLKTKNEAKKDKYPLKETLTITKEIKNYWKTLLDKKLITQEKYNRLVCEEELTTEQLAKFINRQLVETSQSTKAVAGILKNLLPHTEIYYVKAENISEFRQDFAYETIFDEYKKIYTSKVINPELIKIRELNNYHHAHDAYLSIVVGNVFSTKFTKYVANFIEKNNKNYTLNNIYGKDVKNAWIVGETIETIKKEIQCKRINISKKVAKQKGALFNKVTIYNKKIAKTDGYFALKNSEKQNTEKLNDVSKYGGYTSISIAYYSIISYEIKTKNGVEKQIKLIPIPVYIDNKIKDNNCIINYFKNIEKNEIYNPKLLYKKLCIGSLVKINNFYYYVGGKTNDRFTLDSAVEVLIDKEHNRTLKEISKFVFKFNSAKTEKEREKLKVNEKIISLETNLKLFDHLVEKMNSGIFKNKQYNKYDDFKKDQTKNIFKNLSLEAQCIQILEILNILATYKTNFDKLKTIDIITSRTSLNMNITKLDEFKIIEKSVTGLYEKIVTII